MGRKKIKVVSLSAIVLIVVLITMGWYFLYQWPYSLFQKYTAAYVNDIVVCPISWQEPYLKKGLAISAEKAEKGNLDAQFNQAIAYLGGVGTQKDQILGMGLMQKTAEKGLPIAEATYGFLLDPNLQSSEGYSWYKKAADQGNALGQFFLATYEIQKADTPSNEESYFLTMSHLTSKLGVSKELLGDAYNNGFGTARNEQQAVKWYHAAFDDPTIAIQYKVQIANKLASIYSQDPSAQKQAQDWSDRAVKLSSQSCQRISF